MAFKEAMELGQSPLHVLGRTRVQKEEEWQRHDSSAKGSPDVSMVDDSPLEHDSDVVVEEEEREESMDTDVPASPVAPCASKGDTPLQECFEAREPDDHCSHTSEEEHQPKTWPHDLDPDEDELLGPVTDISIPGGQSDDSITHFPGGKMTCN